MSVAAAALTIYLGFHAGGFFPTSTALVAVALSAVMIVRTTVITRPFAGIGREALVALAAIVLYALWTLASAAWSHATGRAMVEFDRVLLYALAFAVFASASRRPLILRALARGVALGGLVLCAAGLATRTLPHLFPINPGLDSDRLSYPLTYWNGLGLLAVLTVLLLIGLSASPRETRPVRVLAAGAVPVPAATLLLTFSRGSISVAVVGLVVLILRGGPRRLLSTMLCTLPPAAAAMTAAYGARALAKRNPVGTAAVTQGRHLVLIVGACCAITVVLRMASERWDWLSVGPVVRWSRRRRGWIAFGASGAITAAIAVALIAGGAHSLSQQYERFLHGTAIRSAGDVRSRLFDPANNGRLDQWRVALKGFNANPLRGTGAGTYQLQWERYRHLDYSVVNAHSLYLETMGELGIVGLILLLVALFGIIYGLARGVEADERPLRAALLAGAVSWTLEAGIDWIWQMPVLTIWLFAAGGAALARRVETDIAGPAQDARARGIDLRSRPLARLLASLAVLLIAVTPATVGLSQLRLDQSVAAFGRGDCRAAVNDALGSVRALSARAEPFEILAYCDAKSGLGALAATMAAKAIQRDPLDWEYHYDLALVRGAFGLDPRPAAANALKLNPMAYQAQRLVSATSSPRRGVWERACRSAPLLVS